MPIEQLAQPCWYTKRPGRDESRWHYETQASMNRAAEEIAEEEPGAVIEIGQLTSQCFIVTCDGTCEDHPEDDECYDAHSPTRAAAEKWAESCGWTVTRDGQVFCEDDVPECSRADLAVTEQIPGQEALPGIEVAANA